MASWIEALQADSCELEAAIRSGNVNRAIELARKLAQKKTDISLGVNSELQLSLPERPISVKIFIEDRHTSGVHVTWKLLPSMKFLALKCMVYEKFEFPIEVQRWIVRKRLVADNETLARLKEDEPVYLYLVPGRSCGVTRESARATYDRLSQHFVTHSLQRYPQPGTLNQQYTADGTPPNPLYPAGDTWNPQFQAGGTPNPQFSSGSTLNPQFPAAGTPNPQQWAAGVSIQNDRHDGTPASAESDVVSNHQHDGDNIAGDDITLVAIATVPVGWVCPQCTLVNEPTRPGCKACSTVRPEDYKIPDDYIPSDSEQLRLDRERQLEAQALLESETQRRVNLEQILSIDERPLVMNTSTFCCSICFDDIAPGGGVILRDCLHSFCIDCLCGHVQAASSATVTCPFNDGSYACESQLLEREIKALVTPAIYERLQVMSMQEAEACERNSFHCCTADCRGWCIYEDDVNTFDCPVCQHSNCLTCKAQHEGETCRQYQDGLNARAANDVAAQRTQRKIEKMLGKGNAMNCPTCKIVVMKKDGCDWIRCTMCKTEICWVTKGPRWGPGGADDESGGCHCGKDGKLCHPKCQNCH